MSERSVSRREFLRRQAFYGASLLATATSGGCHRCDEQFPGGRSGGDEGTAIDTAALAEWRDEYRKELFERFLPNMDRYAVDHEHGGVMCSLDVRTGALVSTDKTAWFVGRAAWLYSFLYRNLDPDPRHLHVARKSVELLLGMQPADAGFWPLTFTRDGTPLEHSGDIYGNLFVAEGLAEYAAASGDMRYRRVAKKIVLDCVARYDDPDYHYVVGHLEAPPPVRGPRVLGHWMVFLKVCTGMLEHEPDADLETLAARCVDAVLNHHVNADYGLANEILDHDLRLPDNAYAQFSIVGHGMETLAFVMFEAARRKDADVVRAAQAAFKRHVDVAADDLYGGYFSLLLNAERYEWGMWKSLWCQQEVANGCVFLIEHTGDRWALRHFARAHDFMIARYRKPGYKFWLSGTDRTMKRPNRTLLEHYHHARHLMLTVLALERMIARRGAISGRFGG